MTRAALVFFVLVLLVGCGGGAGGGDSARQGGGAPLLLAAGMLALDPAEGGAWSAGVDLGRLGVSRVDAVYDLSTPAGRTFAFDVLSRGVSNAGSIRVSLAHAADAGALPLGGIESLVAAGMVPTASGITGNGPWLDATGDGFARITLQGAIEREQVLAFRSQGGEDPTTVLVRLRIGPPSQINHGATQTDGYPGLLDEADLYSSDSWLFGLPTVAVSGDRTSVVCYEGDRADPQSVTRYEMRLQHASATGSVTGGAALEPNPDSGNWRDHEIAALFNVLVLARCHPAGVTVKFSFDRGASFTQTEHLGAGLGSRAARLVQVALAADYSLAVIFWQGNQNGSTDLMLAEGRPSPFPPGGTPAHFDMDPPQVLHHVDSDVTPLLMQAAWSDGGDLVVGYGYSSFRSNPDGTWTSDTHFRCNVRLFGETQRDTLVEQDLVVGKDPSVGLVGSGDALRIFYAYEGRDGIRLRTSDDAGATFGDALIVGDRSAFNPTVLARTQNGAVRVDVLYLTGAAEGTELHLRHWDDYDLLAPGDHRLTKAAMLDGGGGAMPPAGSFAVPQGGFRIRQVAWFGYDAVLDGDDVVVVYDEVTTEAWIMIDFGGLGLPAAPEAAGPSDAGFTPAEPPPLAPGLTESLPPPDPGHMHQLRLLRLD